MMKIQLGSKTATGKAAAVLSLMFIVLITLKIRVAIPLPTFLIAGIGLAGFLAGLIAVVKNKDRSLLVLLSVLVGVLIILWTAAEIAFPH